MDNTAARTGISQVASVTSNSLKTIVTDGASVRKTDALYGLSLRAFGVKRRREFQSFPKVRR